MGKVFSSLISAGQNNTWALVIILVLLVLWASWKLWSEVVTLRRTFRKENMDKLFDVLNSDGIDAHPIQVELAFREFFGLRLTIGEIKYFLHRESPLTDIIFYKYGHRHIDLKVDSESMKLKRSFRHLWWLEKVASVILFLSLLGIVFMLLFTMAAIATGASAQLVATGLVGAFGAAVLLWQSIDGARAVNSAMALVDKKQQSQNES